MADELTIVIPTHGRPTLLGRTLRSIALCDRPDGYAGCIVVENGPPSGAEAVVSDVAAEYPEAGLRYLHHTQANKSAALNAALVDVPDDTLVVFFDDDVRVEPGVLTAYAEAQRAGHYFGGATACDYEKPPPSWLLASLPLSARGFGGDEAARVPFFLGFNWAAFAGDVRAAGGFDPEFGPGAASGARGQESEAQKALRAIGVQPRFVPDARVWHYVPQERCSFTWAVRRKYAVGLMLGQHGGGEALSRSQRATAAARLGVTAVARTLLGHPDRGCLDFMNAVKQVGAAAGRPSAPTRLTP